MIIISMSSVFTKYMVKFLKKELLDMDNRIKALREDRDLRQSDLAEFTGIDQRTISNYETGKSRPDSYALIKLAYFFNVSIDYLVGRTNENYYNNDDKKKAIEKIQASLEDLKKSI